MSKLTDMWTVLHKEICFFEPKKPELHEIQLRVFVKSVVAGIEGMTFAFKQECLKHTDRLSPEEILSIEEKSPSVRDGKVEKNRLTIRTADNVQLAFTLWQRVFDLDVKVNYSTAGWDALKKTIGKRNQITHPKSAESLDVSEEEAFTAKLAYLWFNDYAWLFFRSLDWSELECRYAGFSKLEKRVKAGLLPAEHLELLKLNNLEIRKSLEHFFERSKRALACHAQKGLSLRDRLAKLEKIATEYPVIIPQLITSSSLKTPLD